jgi:drug/metabolite transporter (DMT)-like permease
VLAALVLGLLAAQRDALAPLRGRVGPLVVLAAMQVAVPFVLLTYGEQHIPSALTGVLVATAPIFTAMLVTMGVGEEARMEPWSLAGIGVGILGIGLLFGVDLTSSREEALGGLMVIGTAFGYAAGALYLRRHFLGVAPVGVAAGSMAFSALLVLPVALFQLPDGTTLRSAAAVAALGILGTGLAFWIFYTLIADVGAAKASVVAYLAPGFALAYGAIFLSETITVGSVGGLLMILAGSWLTAEGRAPWRRKPVPVPA